MPYTFDILKLINIISNLIKSKTWFLVSRVYDIVINYQDRTTLVGVNLLISII